MKKIKQKKLKFSEILKKQVDNLQKVINKHSKWVIYGKKNRQLEWLTSPEQLASDLILENQKRISCEINWFFDAETTIFDLYIKDFSCSFSIYNFDDRVPMIIDSFSCKEPKPCCPELRSEKLKQNNSLEKFIKSDNDSLELILSKIDREIAINDCNLETALKMKGIKQTADYYYNSVSYIFDEKAKDLTASEKAIKESFPFMFCIAKNELIQTREDAINNEVCRQAHRERQILLNEIKEYPIFNNIEYDYEKIRLFENAKQKNVLKIISESKVSQYVILDLLKLDCADYFTIKCLCESKTFANEWTMLNLSNSFAFIKFIIESLNNFELWNDAKTREKLQLKKIKVNKTKALKKQDSTLSMQIKTGLDMQSFMNKYFETAVKPISKQTVQNVTLFLM